MTNRIEQIGNTTRDSEQPHKARQARKHEKALGKLGQPFEDIGTRWLDYLNQKTTSPKQIREDWKKLIPQLTRIQESERPVLIKRLADGLNLSEEKRSKAENVTSDPLFRYSLGGFLNVPGGRRVWFSSESKRFMEVIGDLFGYYDDQRASFRNFMNTREDLQRLVRLPQTFPAVAEWLVQSINNPQSSRLS